MEKDAICDRDGYSINSKGDGGLILRLFLYPAEVGLLISDPSKARTGLKWEPAVSFKELVTMMVDADLARQAHGGLFLNNFLQVKEKDIV